MRGRFKALNLVLVALIIGFFVISYFGELDLPAWLWFVLAVVVIGGAIATFLIEYRLSQEGAVPPAAPQTVRDPEFVTFLFNDVRTAPFWLVIRIYLGLQWLSSGWGKVTDPAWMEGGEALQSFWERVVQVPEPPARPPITYDWYRDFLQFMLDQGWYTWFAPLIAIGEVLIGIALIIGALVGIAAAFGLMMNTAFMLAGTASTNPVLGALAILLILGWKVAGHWGVDRYLLPALGAPWSPGWLARGREPGGGGRSPA